MGSSTSKTRSSPASIESQRVLSIPHHHSNEHVNLLVKGLVALRNNGALCDVTICTRDSGKNLLSKHYAHKCVLAASSGYFRKKLNVSLTEGNSTVGTGMLAGDSPAGDKSVSSTSDMITLEFPVSYSAMEVVLNYIYSAVLEAKLELIPEVMDAAIKLEIESLKRRCVSEIEIGFQLEYFQRVYRFSCSLDLPELRDFVLRQVIEKFDHFVDTDCFLSLTESEMKELTNHRTGILSSTCVIPELQVFNGILKWANHNHQGRKYSALKLLKCLHYEKIPQSALSGYVLTHDIVYKDKELLAIVEGRIEADKKRILQRLKDHNHSAALQGDGDPVPPSRFAVVITGGRLYDQFVAKVQELNEKEGAWKEVTRMPSPLSHHSVAVKDNILYVAGGEDTSMIAVKALSSLWSYNPTKNEWETLPEMQHGRSYFPLNVLDQYLFAIGGKSNKITRMSVEKYCIDTKRWEFSHSLKHARHAHAGCSYKQHIYVCGGVVKHSTTCDTIRFNIETNLWQPLAPMHCHRSRHCMAPVRDRIYVFGGESEIQGVSHAVNIAIECYTPQCDQWHKVAQKVSFQSNIECGCVELADRIYLVGGCRSNLTDHRNEVASYDPENDTWITQVKLSRRLRGVACAVLALR